ncbi:zinc finger c2h2-type protein [Diplodia corticola]|uniref:Zinc finger c2h2-type protein n=1 Tax=Diplodia corticola TaxID=236234 RepID=A0A1J9R8U9_9PEZI|nr:zinc finger c2h2-type protein [Diplodia corticola]OJD28835.1 zinc finger c2h2-type protein [Diplodia corticola]
MNAQNFGTMMGAQQQHPPPPQHQRLQQVILTQLRNSHRPTPGQWQASLNAEQRAGMLWNIYTAIRLAKPDVPDQQVLQMAFGNENERFVKAQSREEYIKAVKDLLTRLQSMRQQNMQAVQASLMHPGTNAPNPQAGMMPQTPMQPSGSNQGQNAFQQPFPPQLQHQMQASPLPMTQNPSSMGMENPGLQPQAQQQTMQQQMPRGPQQFTPEEQQRLEAMTRTLRQRMTPEEEARIRAQIAQLPPERRQMLESRGVDPVMLHCRNRAQSILMNMKKGQPMGQGGQFGQQQNQGMGRGAPNQGMMQRTPQMGNVQPQQGGIPGNADFDFAQLSNQQADAMRSAQAGHDVVPASNNANLNQMGGFNPMGGGQPGQVNGQGMAPGQNRNPGQQPPFSIQQAQRENAIRQMQAQAAQAQARGQGVPQSQAQAQQMALRNQMGGFNMGPGQPQNGAMPMLTRPMVPPGQQGNATPQPRPQQPGQQMPQGMGQGINAAQAVQIAQQRAAAAQAQMPGAPQASRASQIPADVPLPIRSKMMDLPDEQFRIVLGRWITQKQQGGWAGNANVSQPGQQMTPQALQGGQPGGPMGMGQNFLQQNQQMGMMNPAQMQQRLQQELLRRQQHQQNSPALNPQVLQRMDQTAFPPMVTQSMRNQGVNLPDNIRSWGQLKEWASRNPSVISMDKLSEFQRAQFERMTQQAQQQAQQQQQANNAGMHGLPGGLPNGAGGALGPGHPNGQAPQAPMMAGAGGNHAQMHQQMSIATQRQRVFALAQQISPQDIQRIRQQQGPKVANLSDDALRQQIAMIRLQQQRQLQQQGPQQGMMPQVPGGGLAMQPGANLQQPQRPGQPPQPQATPQPKLAQQPQAPQRPGPQPGQAPNAMPKMPPQKGVKRPSSDDVVEVQDPAKNQAPPMQPSQSQQRQPPISKEQFASLNPQQQAAVRQSMLQAAQAQGNRQAQAVGNNAQGPAQQEALKRQFSAMMHETMKNMDTKQPIQDLSQGVKEQMAAEVQKALTWINKLDSIMFVDWLKHRDNDRAKNIIQVRHLLNTQLDPQTRRLKDNVSIPPGTLQKLLNHISSYIRSVVSENQNHSDKTQSQANGQEGAQQQQPGAATTQGGQGAELNAVNLEKLRQEQLQRSRAPSNAGVKPPAAPTSAQPPFSFGGGQSPNGAPLYAPNAANPLTPEKLKLPQNKKRKTAPGMSATSTPSQTPVQTTSPLVGNKPSPEMTRREGLQQQQAVPAKPRFLCPHPACDHSARGFETKDELENHVKDAHAKVEDPLQFAIDAVNEGLGLNPDGTAKPKAETNAVLRGKPAPPMPKQQLATKPGQTPQIKAEAGTPATGAGATPMNRVPTQNGIKNSPSASFKVSQMAVKGQTPGSSGAPAMHRTPSKAAKDTNKAADVAMEDQSAPKPPGNPWDECPISSDQLQFMFADEDVAKAMLELPNSAFIAKEDLEREERQKNKEKVEPRSTTPATTPSPASTKDSKETGSSDISENDKLNITIASDDAEWNKRAMDADVDFSSMMDSLFVLDESNNMTVPQNEDNQEMVGPYGFWRDSLGPANDKLPGWDAADLGASYDFFNAPPAPTNEQDLKDLFGITSGMDGFEDMGMVG